MENQVEPRITDVLLKAISRAEVYVQLLGDFPRPERFDGVGHPDAVRADGSSTRGIFLLDVSSATELTDGQRDFWDGVTRGLRSDEVKRGFFRRLRKGLAHRYAISTSDVEAIDAHVDIVLSADVAGYRIGPHPDGPEKIVVVQFYLPFDEIQREFGTTFYRRNREGSFVTLRKCDFKPNSGFAFAKSPESWHAVPEPLPKSASPRCCIMLRYFAPGHAPRRLGYRFCAPDGWPKQQRPPIPAQKASTWFID